MRCVSSYSFISLSPPGMKWPTVSPAVEKRSNAVAQNIIKLGGHDSCYAQWLFFFFNKPSHFTLQLTVWTF